MRTPFDVHTEDFANNFHCRLSHVRDDRLLIESGQLVLVLDAFFLYCLFLDELGDDINGWCARRIYNRDIFRLAVLPETLWEIKHVLEDALSGLMSAGDINEVKLFLKKEEVKRFTRMMEEEGSRDWDAILNLVIGMTSDNSTRAGVMALFRYETVRRFERPLSRLADDLARGRIIRLSGLCDLFGVSELGVNEQDKRSAYSLLSSYRDRGKSDLIDAVVYARCTYLNGIAEKYRIGYRCRFLSHETMIEMLHLLDSSPKKASTVRSLTDLNIALELLDRRVSWEDIDSLWRMSAKVVEAEGRKVNQQQIKRTEILRGKLRLLKEKMFDGAPEVANFPSFNFPDLARKRIQQFFETVNHLKMDPLSFGERRAQHKKQVVELYQALNNLKGRENSLQDFMEPIIQQSQKVLNDNEAGDEENIEFLTDYLCDCAEVDEISEILVELLRAGANFKLVNSTVRDHLGRAPLVRLPILVKFLQEVEFIAASQTKATQNNDIKTQKREILDFLKRRADENVPIDRMADWTELYQKLRELNSEELYNLVLEEANQIMEKIQSSGHREHFAELIISIQQLKIRS